MKKLIPLILFLFLAEAGSSQFVTKPLNYPNDGYYYFPSWMSIADANSLWIGTVKQDPNAGYKAYSAAVHTTDGGNTWIFNTIPIPGSPLAQAVGAVSASVCYYGFSDNISYGGTVWRTTDGGSSWALRSTTQFSGGFINAIFPFTADTVVALGDPNGGYFEVQLSYDGGASWTRVTQPNMPVSLSGEWSMPDLYSRVGNSIWFTTAKGRIFRSSDRGVTWTVTTIGGLSRLVYNCFSDELNGIAFLSDPAAYYKTTDGGASWSAQQAFFPGYVLGHMSNVGGINGGYVISANDTSNPGTFDIFYSHDNLNTIVKIDTGITNSGGNIYFRDAVTGWLSGSYIPANNIYKFNGILTGVQGQKHPEEIMSVYPNPANTAATVVFPASVTGRKKQLKLFDLKGAEYRNLSPDPAATRENLDVRNLGPGLYFLELFADGKMVAGCKLTVVH